MVEIVKAGVFNLFTGGDTTGALWRVKRGHKTEIAAGSLDDARWGRGQPARHDLRHEPQRLGGWRRGPPDPPLTRSGPSRSVAGRPRGPTIPAMTDRPLKVLIAKPGLDGHDRGAKVLARGLRDEGFEVVYTGLRQTPEMIATAALQEDVDVVGLSILSGAHMTLVPRVTRLLTDQGMADVLVTVGGIIPDDDVAALKTAGVAEVFGPGTTIAQVAEYLRANARPRE